MSPRAGQGTVTVAERRARPVPSADPAQPLLRFDFSRPPQESSRSRADSPSSVKEAIIRWLEQQL